MSESEEIISQFYAAKRIECEKLGCPVVCVAGWVSHAMLYQALKSKFSGAVVTIVEATEHTAPLTWDGVKIYPSLSFERGFYFGNQELPRP